MSKRKTLTLLLGSLGILLTGGIRKATAQQRIAAYDLQPLQTTHQLEALNRQVSAGDKDKKAVRLSASEDDGVAWINGINFSDGIIEVDVKGKDVYQQSFLGIAFHGVELKTLDAVYLRPFNFHTTDSVRRIHQVQYVSHPQYTWQVLREKFNGDYEKGLISPPAADSWVHLKVVVKYPQITVFINGEAKPALSVKQLNDRRSGKLGLWVGNGSDGEFANLKVTFAD